MRITEGQLRRIVREELRESMKGQTFHRDPVTGEWTAGVSGMEGPGAQMAMKMREPRITGVGRIGNDKQIAIKAMADLQRFIDTNMMGGFDLEEAKADAMDMIQNAVTRLRDPVAQRNLREDMEDMLNDAMFDAGMSAEEDEDEYDIMDDPNADPDDVADLPGHMAQAWHRKHRDPLEDLD